MAGVTVRGLTSVEAEELLDRFGPNDPSPRRRSPGALQLLFLFANPMVIILLCAATASAFLGQLVDATIITVMVLLGVAINFVQTYRSHKAVERLRNQVTLTATVERDGTWMEIPRREVVPGDLIRLSAGDLVPADARLVESRAGWRLGRRKRSSSEASGTSDYSS